MTPISYPNFTSEEMSFIADAFSEEGPFFISPPISPLTLFALEEQPALLYPSSQERNCCICSKTTTRRWYKNPSDKQKDLCKKCYNAQQRTLSLTGSLGRTCSTPSCQTTSTNQWYKDPLDKKKKDLCKRCYQAQKRALTQTDEPSSNPRKKPKIV